MPLGNWFKSALRPLVRGSALRIGNRLIFRITLGIKQMHFGKTSTQDFANLFSQVFRWHLNATLDPTQVSDVAINAGCKVVQRHFLGLADFSER